MYKILYSGCLLGKVWFVSIDKCIPRNIQFWQENHYLFFALRLAFLYPWSYLKVSSKHENQDELNGCSLVKHHSQVSSPLKLLARCAINVSALHGYFMCTWKVDTLLRIRKVSLLPQLCKDLNLVQTHKYSLYFWDKVVLTKFISGCRMFWDLICGASWSYKSRTEKVTVGRKSAILPNWCCLLFITVLSGYPCFCSLTYLVDWNLRRLRV